MRSMKKRLYLPVLFLTMMLAASPAGAYQTRSSRFNSAAVTGNRAADMVSTAMAQKGRTQSSMGYTEPWCADFVLDCARRAGIPTSVIPYTTAADAACGSFYNHLVRMGAQKISQGAAKPGDLVFYYCKTCGSYTHVGIYAGNGYYIEGNMSSAGKGSHVMYYNTNYGHSSTHRTNTGHVERRFLRPKYEDNNVAYAQVSLMCSTFTYNMLSHKPGVTVKLNGKALAQGTDYTLQYANTVNAGTASVKITAKGKYVGTKTVTYKIHPYDISGLKGFSVSDQVYTGKQLKPGIRFAGTRAVGNMITKSGQIRVSYGANKKMGKGTVTVKGIGNLTGSRTLTFLITPKKTSGLQTTIRAGRVTLKWGIQSNTAGYEISWRKAWGGSWSTRTSGSASCVLSLSRLTKYEARVRAYIYVDGRKVYGAWSDTKTFTTKLF